MPVRDYLSFETDAFDWAKEPVNPFNGHRGHGAPGWFVASLRKRGYTASDPGPEDLGWYSLAQEHGRFREPTLYPL